jgi:hypothetical protein
MGFVFWRVQTSLARKIGVCGTLKASRWRRGCCERALQRDGAALVQGMSSAGLSYKTRPRILCHVPHSTSMHTHTGDPLQALDSSRCVQPCCGLLEASHEACAWDAGQRTRHHGSAMPPWQPVLPRCIQRRRCMRELSRVVRYAALLLPRRLARKLHVDIHEQQ